MRERPTPITSMNCFGESGVDIGQKRLPTPPAMIIICMSCINLVIYFENLPVLPYR